MRANAYSLLSSFILFSLTGCGGQVGDVDDAASYEAELARLSAVPRCGGDKPPCRDGTACVDDPRDDCDPRMAGPRVCPGFCVAPVPAHCGPRTGYTCPDPMVCVDDPRDDCSPVCGRDCPRVCKLVVLEPARDYVSCGGIIARPCPDGLTCVDDPRDKCDPLCGGADCPGICKKTDY